MFWLALLAVAEGPSCMGTSPDSQVWWQRGRAPKIVPISWAFTGASRASLPAVARTSLRRHRVFDINLC